MCKNSSSNLYLTTARKKPTKIISPQKNSHLLAKEWWKNTTIKWKGGKWQYSLIGPLNLFYSLHVIKLEHFSNQYLSQVWNVCLHSSTNSSLICIGIIHDGENLMVEIGKLDNYDNREIQGLNVDLYFSIVFSDCVLEVCLTCWYNICIRGRMMLYWNRR